MMTRRVIPGAWPETEPRLQPSKTGLITRSEAEAAAKRQAAAQARTNRKEASATDPINSFPIPNPSAEQILTFHSCPRTVRCKTEITEGTFFQPCEICSFLRLSGITSDEACTSTALSVACQVGDENITLTSTTVSRSIWKSDRGQRRVRLEISRLG